MASARGEGYARALRILTLEVTCPDAELASMVADGTLEHAMTETADELGLSWERSARSAWFDGADAQNAASLLRREYTRLFSDPSGAAVPPWETAFLDPRGEHSEFGPQLVRTAAADDARRFYRSCGWDLASNEAADHMRIELEFAASLLHCDDKEAAVDAGHMFDRFWDVHLSRWMRPFFEQVAQEARHGFYGDIGRFGVEVSAALSQGVQ